MQVCFLPLVLNWSEVPIEGEGSTIGGALIDWEKHSRGEGGWVGVKGEMEERTWQGFGRHGVVHGLRYSGLPGGYVF